MTERLPWHHIHLTHEDKSNVAAWYVEHLGAFRGEPTERSEKLLYGTKNLVQIENKGSVIVRPAGEVDHMGLGAPDVDEAIAGVVAAGGKDLGNNFITDPFGTRIHLTETDDWCFHHAELVANDPKQLADWYALNFGGEVVTCPWDDGKLAIAYDDSMWLVLRTGEPSNEPPGRVLSHCGWRTSDIKATVAQMRANGCNFPIPPIDIGTDLIAFAKDPSGLWVELVEPLG